MFRSYFSLKSEEIIFGLVEKKYSLGQIDTFLINKLFKVFILLLLFIFFAL